MNLYNSETYCRDIENTWRNVAGIDMLHDRTLIITGCTGTIGSWIADTLLFYNKKNNANIRVILAGRSIERMRERFLGFPGSSPEFLQYDIRDLLDWTVPADYIIHAAGNAHPAAFNGDPCGTITGNILGTWNLLQYGLVHGCSRFLYVSTGEVYGQGDLSLESFDETCGGYVDPVSPRSSYPNSKRTAETLCASFTAQYGMETVIVRPSHTYGPCITPSDNRANVQFLKNGFHGENIVMKSAGSQIRSYTYVPDCVSAILTVLIHGERANAYNIAVPGARASIADFARTVAELSGTELILADPTDADLADRTPIAKQVLSSGKTEALGWKGVYDVRTGIEHTLRIWRECAGESTPNRKYY